MKWGGLFLLALWGLTVLQVVSFRFINPPLGVARAWRAIWATDGNSPPSYPAKWRPLGRISPHLRRAVLAAEDQRFVSHHGFDFVELREAFKNLARQRGVRGASTITMQVARTVFLWSGRIWPRKMAEAYYTVLIEIFWSKKRILEIYLNRVDWGRGIEGAEAAAWRYFHTSSARLSPSQAALLAAVLPNPHKWSPVRPNAHVRRRQKRILRDMEQMPLL